MPFPKFLKRCCGHRESNEKRNKDPFKIAETQQSPVIERQKSAGKNIFNRGKIISSQFFLYDHKINKSS